MNIKSMGWDLVVSEDNNRYSGNKEAKPRARRQSPNAFKVATEADFEGNDCDCLICHLDNAKTAQQA